MPEEEQEQDAWLLEVEDRYFSRLETIIDAEGIEYDIDIGVNFEMTFYSEEDADVAEYELAVLKGEETKGDDDAEDDEEEIPETPDSGEYSVEGTKEEIIRFSDFLTAKSVPFELKINPNSSNIRPNSKRDFDKNEFKRIWDKFIQDGKPRYEGTILIEYISQKLLEDDNTTVTLEKVLRDSNVQVGYNVMYGTGIETALTFYTGIGSKLHAKAHYETLIAGDQEEEAPEKSEEEKKAEEYAVTGNRLDNIDLFSVILYNNKISHTHTIDGDSRTITPTLKKDFKKFKKLWDKFEDDGRPREYSASVRMLKKEEFENNSSVSLNKVFSNDGTLGYDVRVYDGDKATYTFYAGVGAKKNAQAHYDRLLAEDQEEKTPETPDSGGEDDSRDGRDDDSRDSEEQPDSDREAPSPEESDEEREAEEHTVSGGRWDKMHSFADLLFNNKISNTFIIDGELITVTPTLKKDFKKFKKLWDKFLDDGRPRQHGSSGKLLEQEVLKNNSSVKHSKIYTRDGTLGYEIQVHGGDKKTYTFYAGVGAKKNAKAHYERLIAGEQEEETPDTPERDDTGELESVKGDKSKLVVFYMHLVSHSIPCEYLHSTSTGSEIILKDLSKKKDFNELWSTASGTPANLRGWEVMSHVEFNNGDSLEFKHAINDNGDSLQLGIEINHKTSNLSEYRYFFRWEDVNEANKKLKSIYDDVSRERVSGTQRDMLRFYSVLIELGIPCNLLTSHDKPTIVRVYDRKDNEKFLEAWKKDKREMEHFEYGYMDIAEYDSDNYRISLSRLDDVFNTGRELGFEFNFALHPDQKGEVIAASSIFFSGKNAKEEAQAFYDKKLEELTGKKEARTNGDYNKEYEKAVRKKALELFKLKLKMKIKNQQ